MRLWLIKDTTVHKWTLPPDISISNTHFSSPCPLVLYSVPLLFFSLFLILSAPCSSSHRRWMLQTDVKVFGLVRLHTAQGHPWLPNELIMCQLVFVTHGHPASERQGEGGRICEWRKERNTCIRIQVAHLRGWCTFKLGSPLYILWLILIMPLTQSWCDSKSTAKENPLCINHASVYKTCGGDYHFFLPRGI